MFPRKCIFSGTAILASLAAAAPAQAQIRSFDIPARPAVKALPELARQARIQILASARDLKGVRTPAIKGTMDAREALRRLIAGTPLQVVSDDGQTVTLRSRRAPASPRSERPQSEQVAGKGTLAGQVIDAATGEYLRDATIEVVAADGDRRTSSSSEGGAYRLLDLPAGSARVTVRFTGYASQAVEVAIRPGQTARLDFNLLGTSRDSAARGNEIVVSGVREGDARAIMSQRQAMDIKQVLSAESYGDIADGNPAEFLKFMPGVDTDGTNGTAINVYLRGLPQDYTQVTLNGMNLVSADANTGSGSARVFSFEAMSLSGIDSIEISKTTSADVDANAPAGTINIRTRRAFDRKKGLLTVQLGAATHTDMWDGKKRTGPQDRGWGGQRFLPNAQLSYTDSFFGHRLGVAASVGYTDTYIEREEITLSRNYVPTASSPDPLGITAIAPQLQARETKRFSATLSVDFKAGKELVLSLMGALNRGRVFQNEWTPTYTTGVRSAGLSGDPLFDFTTQQAPTAKSLGIATATQYKINNGNFIAPSFEWTRGNLRLDGYFAYSDAESYYDTPAKGQVVTLTSALSSVGNFSAQRSPDLKQADWAITQISGPDWSDPASFTLAGVPTIRTTNGSTAEVKMKSGGLNLTYEARFGSVPVELKTGFKFSDTTFDFDDTSANNLYAYSGPLSNAEFLRAIQGSRQLSYADSGGSLATLSGADYLYTPSLARLYRMFTQNPGEWTHTLTPANWYAANVANKAHYEESIRALYIMGTAELTPSLKFRAGLRWERTGTATREFDSLSAEEVKAAGYAVEAATGRATTIPGLEYQFLSRAMTERKGSYSNLFPSASLKYEFDQHTQLQLGYSRTILRPEPDVLAGVTIVDEIDRTVTTPNPSVEPAISDNLSLRLARYFEPVGIVAINFYLNRVKGLFQEQELTAQEFGYTGTQYADYTFITTTTVSGNAVNIKGVEFEFNHALSYLPAPFDGLSVRGSFMYNDPDVPIVRVADKVGTLSLSYKKGPLRLFLNSVWTGDKYRSTTPSWFDQRWDVSLSGSYRFQRNLEAFFSIRNLLNQPVNVIVPGSLAKSAPLGDHSAIYVENGINGTIGIRARF